MHSKNISTVMTSLFCVALTSTMTIAAMPPMGGSMIMPSVLYSDVTKSLSVSGIEDDNGNPISAVPVLTPHPEFEILPGSLYAPLKDQAYNRQYGWNMDSASDPFPTGKAIWFEVISSTQGLKVYDRMSYAPILEAPGARWLWSRSMAHNAYAVEPQLGSFSATYQLYIGDPTTGAPDPAYSGTQVTLNWTSIPEPASVCVLGMGGLLLRRRRL